jgi:uncharacterized membrane protein YciS (DUF1049 family)
MSRTVKLTFVLLVVLAGLAFHLRNDQLVKMDLYVVSWQLWFSLWVIIALALGAGLGALAMLPRLLRQKRENARLARQIKGRESELDRLRTLPYEEKQ